MTPESWVKYAARALAREQGRPFDLEDYMAEETRRVALKMPLEAALADSFFEPDDDAFYGENA